MSADRPAIRPNLLIITCHDVGDYWGCYGTPVPTPHIDSLAADGVLFERHFTTATVCSPSRGSITTGCYPPTNGLTGNVHRGDAIDLDRCPATPALLAAQGYETHLFGFQHEHWDGHRLGYQEVHLGATRHVDDVAHALVAWLRARQPGAGPFLVGMGCTETHRNGMAPSGFHYEKYEPADPATVAVRPYLPDIPAVRGELADFYGAIKLVDQSLGLILAALDEAGLRGSTLVVFTSDHGGSFLHSKATVYDGGLKVGLLMRWPGVLPAGGRVGSLTSHVDILPTLLDLLGLPVPAHVQGISAAGLARGTGGTPRQYIYAGRDYGARAVRSERFKYMRNLIPYSVHDTGMREIVLCPAGRWENLAVLDHYEAERSLEHLYDLERDPAELHNVAADPAYAGDLAALRAALDAHLAETDDDFRHLAVPAGLHPPRDAWAEIRAARHRGDPNLQAVVSLGED